MEDDFKSTGLYVPNNFIWDVNNIPTTNVNSPEFSELLIRLYQNINSMCIALNLKDSAYYVQQEFLNSQVFFPNPQDNDANPRQAYRMVVSCGVLPNNTTVSIPHGIENIDGNYSFTRIYGASSNPDSLEYISLPYASSSGTDNIELSVNATNVVITTTADYSMYTVTYVILEYLKN